MHILSPADILFLEVALASSLTYTAHRCLSYLRRKPLDPLTHPDKASQTKAKAQLLPPTRSIKKRLEQVNTQCVIFYGSQTGTAEKLAFQFSKEAKSRFGLESMVADLDDFDYDDLRSMAPATIALFFLATYGEGEATDNAIAFDRYCQSETLQSASTGANTLSTLRYAAFGLGNSSYQHYNSMVKRVDSALTSSGAHRIGEIGLGDDGKRTLADDFIAWKDHNLPLLAKALALSEKPYVFEPTFVIGESDAAPSPDTFLGEPNRAHLKGKIKGPYTASNPFPAPLVTARELFAAGERNCLHIEFDISSSTVTYETGDHVAIWPINSELEVARFLSVFGLAERAALDVCIRSRDPTTKIPIPPKTTYEAVARYYLDICAPVSRQFLSLLAVFAPDDASREKITRLCADSLVFQTEVTSRNLNLAQLLQTLESSGSWRGVPFSLLLENISKLRPRYYSISSSSLTSKKTISITAVVKSEPKTSWSPGFKGVATNYLLALSFDARAPKGHRLDGLLPLTSTHAITGPRGQYAVPTCLLNVRSSNFRLPKQASTPVIMIGPGTGVAPFRAFVHERALLYREGRGVGRTLLFYGCRRRKEDYVYQDEWEVSNFRARQTTLHQYPSVLTS
jgi:NADPH-ferrihemoprotein reductase